MDDLYQKRKKQLQNLWQQSKEREAQRLAERNNLLYINLKRTAIETSALAIVDQKQARKANAVVFQKIGNQLRIAVTDPFNPETIRLITNLKQMGYKIAEYVVTPESLDWALSFYRFIRPKQKKLEHFLDVSSTTFISFQNLHEALLEIKKENVTKLVSLIFKSAVEADASDVHFEPGKESTLIRFRIDGVLYDVSEISPEKYRNISSRLKLLSGIKFNILNAPQNGRFSIKNNDITFDVRVSSLPGPYGEFLVFRILNPLRAAWGLQDLGLTKRGVDIFEKYLQAPNGMILITGPTGSGKTTTLYALLKKKISPGIKIITIEDPIEYKIAGVNQTQVGKGYDFATGLKSILRQDPDVILVGEIRDKETAQTALQAALTGHLVFSTLHTNEASETFARLRELGANSKLMADAIKLVVAQRLVRRLCPYCKIPYTPSPEEENRLLDAFSILSPKSKVKIPKKIPLLYKAKGCPHCHHLGYKGQIGLFEILPVSERITKAITKEADFNTIRKIAIDEGMIPLFHDGLQKVIQGITTIEEVNRVAGDIEYIKTLYQELFTQTLYRELKLTLDDLKKIKQWLNHHQNFASLISSLDYRQKLAYILATAYLSRATDVHLEPQETQAVVRIRIDGVLHQLTTIPKEEYPALINELKGIAGLKTTVTQKIQEGRFKVTLPFKSFDIRLSIIPGGYGETAALRLLGGELQTIELENLGLLQPQLKQLENVIQKKLGLILASGPTSSGKTTTLYAILKKIAQPGIKVITVEDPIEYRLPGIIQTQVNEEKGYTFATALKSLLRQNPNVFLIGEIRDKETAQLVWQASLTGHLVLSTIHTNDAASVGARLESLGIPASEVTKALNVAIAQRLVRKLCPHCKKEIPIPPDMKPYIQRALLYYPQYRHLGKVKKIYAPVGCPKCSFTGYHGQTAVFELLVPDSSRKISSLNFPRMIDSAVIKVLQGITSWEEIKRVLNPPPVS